MPLVGHWWHLPGLPIAFFLLELKSGLSNLNLIFSSFLHKALFVGQCPLWKWQVDWHLSVSKPLMWLIFGSTQTLDPGQIKQSILWTVRHVQHSFICSHVKNLEFPCVCSTWSTTSWKTQLYADILCSRVPAGSFLIMRKLSVSTEVFVCIVEFSLNGVEFSLNSVNSENLRNH